jgi:hypothetical protein
MTEGTSRGPTKTIRFPAGSDLPDWYEQHADATGLKANALMVLVLDRYRAETETDPAAEQESKRDASRTPDAAQT